MKQENINQDSFPEKDLVADLLDKSFKTTVLSMLKKERKNE